MTSSILATLIAEVRTRPGKRLRSRLCRAVFRHARPAGEADLTPLEEALEEVHEATLLHDDIQDASPTRDGRPALWKTRGIPAAVAVGDGLLASACSRVARAPFARRDAMIERFAETLRRLSEGQAAELLGDGDYAQICADKTGALFALAAAFGALAADVDPEPYARWAERFGVFYQAVDDCRDEGPSPARIQLRDATAGELSAASLTAAFADWIRSARLGAESEGLILTTPEKNDYA